MAENRRLEGVLEAEEPPSKVRNMSQKDLYRPPTNEELNELKRQVFLIGHHSTATTAGEGYILDH